jgi:membrane protease subunit HflK
MLRSRPVLLAIAAFFAFALMPIFTRGAQAHILAIAAWRAVLVAVIFGIWTMAKEGGPKALLPDKITLKLGTAYGLALALASSTFVGGYAFTTVANTIFLHNLAPIMAFPLAWWMYKERLSASAMTGAAIAVLGVGLLSGVSLFQVSNYASSRFLIGDFLALISAVGYALVLVLTRLVRQKETPLLGTLWVAWVVAALVLCLIGLIFGAMSISIPALFWVLGLAVICTNVPFYLLNLSMKHIPAGLASVLSLSEVIFATAVGILIYSENLAPIGWLGGALVLVGLLYPLTTMNASGEDTDSSVEEVQESLLSPQSLQNRGWRLGLGLLVFNCGALILFLSGEGGGAVLSWAGLCLLIRLGGRPASQMLAGRFDSAIRWTAAGSALAIGIGLVLNPGWMDASASPLVLIIALGALALDHWLAHRELPEEREAQPLLTLALWALATSQLFALLLHPAAEWLVVISAGALGLQAWTVLLAALRGRLCNERLSQAPGVERLERIGQNLAGLRFGPPLLFLVYVLGGVHIVPAGHQAIIERLGKPQPEAHEAGLVLRLPPPIDAVRLVDLQAVRQVQIIDPGTPLLCQDQTIVTLEMSLHYTISDAHDFAFGAADPATTVTSMGRSALIEAVAARTQDEVLVSELRQVEAEVLANTQLTADASQIGVQVESVHLTRSAVPTPVLSAFLDVASAKADKETLHRQAKAYEFDLLPRTRGKVKTIIAQATIEKSQRVASAQVDHDYFIYLSQGITEGRELSMLRLRLEHIEKALARANLIISPESIQLWLDSSTRLQPKTISALEGP